MKRAYIGVLMGLFLAGSATYGERPARGDSAQNNAQNFRGSPAVERGSSPIIRSGSAQQIFNTVQRDINERRALIQRGITDQPRSAAHSEVRDHDGEMIHRHRGRLVVFVAPAYSDYDYVSEDLQGYYQPGYEWGAQLRQYTISWDQLGPYLEQYVVPASLAAQDAFRRGFIEAFGGNAEALYDRAMKRASQEG